MHSTCKAPGRFIPLAVASVLAACGGKAGTPAAASTPSVSVAVRPARVGVQRSGTATFTATVTGASDQSVTWSVEEATGGTVDTQGRYTAPAVEGTFTVVATSVADTTRSGSAIVVVADPKPGFVIDHSTDKLATIPAEWITKAKQTLHIAYGHTSHGSQITEGMTGLVTWKGTQYAWNAGGTGGALDLRDYYSNFGGLGIANDLGNPDRSAWARATRTYLDAHPEVNVVMWAWCWQVEGTQADIQMYLDLMTQLEKDYPNVKFVYMTGHVKGERVTDNYYLRNKQIRDYCVANDKILYDFADIESWDPSGVYYGDKLVTDNCDYDSNADGIVDPTVDRNWAIDWQNAHPGEWYTCGAAHSQPLNSNVKAYAAWWLWARLAGWSGI